MTIFRFLIISSLLAFTCPAQTLLWAKSMGGPASEYPIAMAVDAQGGVYTTGYFQNIADFDPGPGTFTLAEAGGNDVYISKLDASGNFVWAKRIGNFSFEQGTGIASDAQGNVYVTGPFWGTVDFDPGAGISNLTSAGDYDVFILKLDAQGNFAWAKNMGGSGNDLPRSITTDASGNVYCAGEFENTADLDPGTAVLNVTSNGLADAFICKLDAGGSLLWARQVGGVQKDWAAAIDVDGAGQVYVSGAFKGTVDFDPGSGTSNIVGGTYSQMFILKLDGLGNFTWARNVESNYDVFPSSLVADAQGNVYNGGFYQGTADFDPSAGSYTLATTGYIDAFLLKLDAAGNFVWAGHMGGAGQNVYGPALVQDVNNDIYACGSFSGLVDLDPSVGTYTLNPGISDYAFVLKVGAAGNFIWVKHFGGSPNTYGLSAAADSSGNIYAAGSFGGTGNFDPGPSTTTLTSAGVADIFIMKLTAGAVGMKENAAQRQLSIYPNPAHTSFHIQSEKDLVNAQVTLVNAMGQQVFSTLLPSSSEIHLPGLVPGVYYYQVLQQGEAITKGILTIE